MQNYLANFPWHGTAPDLPLDRAPSSDTNVGDTFETYALVTNVASANYTREERKMVWSESLKPSM